MGARPARPARRPARARWCATAASVSSGSTPTVILPLKPSDYFRRKVYIGASFPSPSDADGVPRHRPRPRHVGQRLPAPRGVLAATAASRCAGRSPGGARPTCARCSSGNAASVYGFDLDLPRADRRRGRTDGHRGGHPARPGPARRHQPLVPPQLTPARPGTARRTGGSVGPCCSSTESGATPRRAPPSSRGTRRPVRSSVRPPTPAWPTCRPRSRPPTPRSRRGRPAPPTSGRRSSPRPISSCSSGARRWPS